MRKKWLCEILGSNSCGHFFPHSFLSHHAQGTKRKRDYSQSSICVAAILDSIKWNNYPHPPQSSDEGVKEHKTCHFGIIKMGGGVVQMFQLFCPRLWLGNLIPRVTPLSPKVSGLELTKRFAYIKYVMCVASG